MRVVSRFEENLLKLLHGLLQRAPREQTWPLLHKRLPRPACLSPDAVALVQDTLAKGTVTLLARLGWRRERFLRDGRATEGRLWERTPPEEQALSFSRHSLELLMQLASGTLGNGVPPAAALTVGDRLLLLLALETFQSEIGKELRTTWTPLWHDGLCRLWFFDTLQNSDDEPIALDWSPWMTGAGAAILETMQDRLAQRWVAVERTKADVVEVARMRTLGGTQQRVWSSYLDALDAAGRRDLARCLVQAARRLQREGLDVKHWTGQLDFGGMRLADRAVVYRAALALMQQVLRLQSWEHEARSIGYFDEGYAASQLWKADWERSEGDLCAERARALLDEAQPLGATT